MIESTLYTWSTVAGLNAGLVTGYIVVEGLLYSGRSECILPILQTTTGPYSLFLGDEVEDQQFHLSPRFSAVKVCSWATVLLF